MSETGTVLLAEDDPHVMGFMSMALSKHGYEVLEAVNGEEAIDIIDCNDSIDAIVSDIDMPRMDGLDFARHNFDHGRLPFIVSTKISDSQLALNLLRFGVRDYLEKPVTEKKIVSVVQNAIHRGSCRVSLEELPVYGGNVESIIIPSRSVEILKALNWARNRTEELFDGREMAKFLDYLHEFLLNAHEHGNLGMGEKEKAALIEADRFHSEIEHRESFCQRSISLAISTLKNEIAVQINDEGNGFDSAKYIYMDENILLERMEMPNGRGIYMSKLFFDSIEYTKGGSQVSLRKTIVNERPILCE